MDGQVSFGSSWVNEAPITGESLPKEKSKGANVFAGSINEGGYLEVKVTKLAKDNTVAKIIQLVEEALADKPPVQRFIDHFASYYTPIILAIALGMVTIPTLFLGQEFVIWFYRALALLLIACPCALIISTPVALVTAMGSSAKEGILLKGGIHLEQMAKVHTIALDKTGTLTKGKPEVSSFTVFGLKEEQVLQGVYSIEKMSEHPLAKSWCHYAQAQGATALPVDSFQVAPGKGVRGVVLTNGEASQWLVGTVKYLTQENVELSPDQATVIDQAEERGDSLVAVAWNGQLVGLITFKDQLRPEANEAIALLKKQGIKPVMLTGDNTRVAKAVATQLGIDQVASQLLPAHKLEKIEELNRQGAVAMVGDGINDAPALAKASVGIAMGVAGTDTALETADVALMGDDLLKLPQLVSLSRRTMGIIKENIVIALGLKLLAVLLIFPGWLTLWMAVVADMGTSLLVTLNGLRLLKK